MNERNLDIALVLANGVSKTHFATIVLARDVIYTSNVICTSRAYATMSVYVCLSVCLSVTEVHCGRGACREEGRGHLVLC